MLSTVLPIEPRDGLMSLHATIVPKLLLPAVVIAIVFGLLAMPSVGLAQGNPFASNQPGYPKWSAFTGVRWENDRPIVQIDDRWYELVSIHGVATEKILEKCAQEGWPAQMRFTEDLVQILRLMGHEIDKTTRLELRDGDGKLKTMTDVPMTKQNLDQVMAASREAFFKAVVESNPFVSSVPGYPRWSAFSGVKWKGDQPTVRVNDAWYELLKIHDVSIDEMRSACEENGWPFRRRFVEDHVQLLRLMGHKIDKTTRLEVRDEQGNIITLKNVVMTEANLRRASVSAKEVSAKAVLEDLQVFQKSLEERFAYLKTNNVDYKAAINAIAEQVDDDVDSAWLADKLQLVISQFVDGHARVSGTNSSFVGGYLPFRIEPSGNQFVAFNADRRSLLEKDYPYIRAIDGIELDRWLKSTEKYIAKGSPQYRRRFGLRYLRSIQQFRKEVGLEQTDKLKLDLVNRDGTLKKQLEIPIADSSVPRDSWPPRKEPGIIDGNIGYLHIASMNDKAVASLKQWMPRFRETDGLIIDVRGNGGGTRKAILELAGYLMTKSDKPRIGNVAKYRLAKEFDEDHLSDARYVYRESSTRFLERERAAIAEFKSGFVPEWVPAKDEFSEWHYLVLSKRDNDPRFDYQNHVVILLDEGCFSATDIFLGTFKGWPNVTLIGQPSGGGSARTQGFRLPNSGISIGCASMASFQPNGKLYDTHGIEPDITVIRPPEYYLQGGEDVILQKALEVLAKNAN